MTNEFMGMGNFCYWFGIVEDRNDPLNIGRCRVRIFAWNTDNKSMLPTKDLLWAQAVLPLNNNAVKSPVEGTAIFGFFMDGQDGQYPIMLGQLASIPDTKPDPNRGFSDPRSDTQLQNAPRPPQNVKLPSDGSGVKITEAPAASKFPNVLNEPTSSRLARHENIEDTVIGQRRNSLVTDVPVGTGAMVMAQPVDIPLLLKIQASLPASVIPQITAGINIGGSFEFCGIGVNANLAGAISFGGIELLPAVSITGEINFGSIPLEAILAIDAALNAAALVIDLAGCILGGLKIGNSLILDGGAIIPLLKDGEHMALDLLTRGTVVGGVSLGTVGGIPLTTQPVWSEPHPPYNAQYPFNHVHETESGHVFEVDDTPGHERIHNYHRSGTFDEVGPDGSKVTKIVKNNYEITLSDNNVMIMGDCNITVKGKRTNLIQGEENTTIDGNNINLIKQNQTDTVLGSRTETITKNYDTTITQNKNMIVKGTNSVVIEKDCSVIVKGKSSIVVGGDSIIAVGGNSQISSKGDTTLIAGGDLTTHVQGDTTLNINGSFTVEAKDMTFTSEGNISITSGGHVEIDGTTITLNSGLTTVHNILEV